MGDCADVRDAGTRGSTVIEVVIGIALVAIVAVSLMSVALTSRQSAGRIARKTAAAMTAKKIEERLKSYVTADTSATVGPGAGADGWTFPGDGCACYALSNGTHTLDASLYLPALSSAPYNAAVSYFVANAETVNGGQPRVELSVVWTEP
ncbi:MAG: hypothetical protein HY403_03095 [Elusimicrobia bacterium]|nr:hypothetical protein [Elusimicrobiota bacterium]